VKTVRHEAPPARKAGVKVASVEELVAKAPQRSEGDLMGTATLVLLETTTSNLRSASLPAVTAARKLAQANRRPRGRRGDRIRSRRCCQDAAATWTRSSAATTRPWLRRWLRPGRGASGCVKQIGAGALLASATSTGKDILPAAWRACWARAWPAKLWRSLGPRPSVVRPTPETH